MTKVPPHLLLPALIGLLAACSDGIGPLRYEVPPQAEEERIPVSVGSVELREVSLPLYAELETITVETPGRMLATDNDVLWADDPVRGMTQTLAMTLAEITPAKVAAEPWPFSDGPDVRVEVRFTQALATAAARYRIVGQYFVASPFGERKDVARRFDIAVPYAPGNPNSIAAAQGAALRHLAKHIAREGL
ncbi:PqiC family protein [Profundibacterium mesophilum]|uniref:Lipoprotein n=1 Tax=Profundibacterium mesophilum KAUST100406-0324 TaxID=1037889 RepID=A0A921TC83_9RHOB|nr:ABC-type transport auxiliary lipoprotein family protein [Profundibacterium mesophilum]KAF0675373.1 lipoprotein [Profundibacterium mesophilum KAUST100406-0324]